MSIKTVILCGIVVCCVAQTFSMVIPGGMGMPGGFGGCVNPITQVHRDAAAAALTSMDSTYTLDTILCVKEQVVNGINYDMQLRVNAGPSCTKTCSAVVYSGPFGGESQSPTWSVTSQSCSNNCDIMVS